MKTQIRIATFLLLSGAAVQAAAVDPVVVILRPDAKRWAFQSATKLLLNGKNKVHAVGANQIDITPEEIKHAPELPIGSTPLRVHRSGYLLARSGSGWVSAFPEGAANSKDSAKATVLWSGARVQIESGRSKEPDISAATVFAILPGESIGDSVAAFLLEESNFTGVGEKDADAAFEERMSLLVGVAASPNGASPQIKTMLLSAMNKALQMSKGSGAKYSELQQGLKFATVSEQAFPSDPEQQQARRQLRERKSLIDRRVAILRALDAGQQYDALIEKYGDFEFYDSDFPDVRSLHADAFKKSVDVHLSRAASFRREKQDMLAMKELKIALLRTPGNTDIEDEIEKIRISEARAHRLLVKKSPTDPNSPEQVLLMKHVHRAESAIADKNFKEAAQEMSNAARIDKDSPRLLLTKARLYVANKQYAQAIEVLDAYDGIAPADETQAGRDLRDDIEGEIRRSRDKYDHDIQADRKNGDFVQGRLAAETILKVAPKDPNFLYDAGVFSAVTRHETEARDYLHGFLSASQSTMADTKKRADVIGWLPSIETSLTPAAHLGAANWFSGAAAAPGTFYCPMSLLPNPKPLDVKATHKQNTTYEWSGNQLLSLNTSTLESGSSEVKIYFDYFGKGKGVKRLNTKPLLPEKTHTPPRFSGDGAVVEQSDDVYPVLFNNPDVNPYLVEQLMGQRVGVIVSGNRYFHPFVWDGVHVFLAEYDSEGRVKSARELHAATPRAFNFKWEGTRLSAIVETGAAEGYSRTMEYDGDRILRETIHFRGRDSHIRYKYKGDRLAEAECDSDPSIDNRARRVTFRD